MKSGTFNVLRTAPIANQTRNERSMLGMSVDKATAEIWLAKYRAKCPQYTFELIDDAPPTTCDIPVLHATAQ